MQRGQRVCVPLSYLDIIDHALIQKFEKKPGFERKQLVPISTYPYSRFEEGTREEYEKQKSEGTVKNREAVEKWGPTASPVLA
jgi:hypothetical protein